MLPKPLRPVISISFCFLTIGYFAATASDLEISGPKLIEDDGLHVEIQIKWTNSWHNVKNHDAIWLFFKNQRNGGRAFHLPLLTQDYPQLAVINQENGSHPGVVVDVAKDQMGAMIYVADTYQGPTEVTLRLKLDEESLGRFRPQSNDNLQAFGLEMVYIPEGPFTLGEPGDAYLEYGGLYLSDQNGEPAGLYSIATRDQTITIAPEAGALYYQAKTGYEGDRKGQLNESFPTGFGAFYIMKYEPTQGQYVDFLNTLTEQQSQHRANFGGRTYYSRRGSIRLEDDQYVADHSKRPCNFMSWDDAMAFADWAALRPLTELEFVKASRGPGEPIENEYPWNTSSFEGMLRQMGSTGEISMVNEWTESVLTEENRAVFGASYYWVIDLAGSMWERVISIGHENGRKFDGNHGDGSLTGYGFADVANWPTGVDGPGGFGYRGGGYYVYPMEFTEFNPYSPIAYRRYGGWSGGNRTEAYGARFARTAEK